MSTNGSPGPGVFGGPINRAVPSAVAALVLTAVSLAALSRVGCVNLVTPAGYEGYIKTNPIFGSAEFDGTQVGPVSTGWVWRRQVVNIDARPRTYSEEMEIPTEQRVNVKFRAHARIKVRAGGIKDIVDELGGTEWYEKNVQQQFRAVVRSKVQQINVYDVKNRMDQIAADALSELQQRYKGSAIEFLSIHIGNIEYPSVVVESVVRKFVTNEDNQRKDIELQIAKREIDIGVAEAEGVADSQKVIRTTLDPMFLQYEALKAIERLAGSEDTTFVVVPFSERGSAPIIMSMDK